jgi:hypothetical protein
MRGVLGGRRTALLALASLLLVAGRVSPGRPEPRLIILFDIDMVRADHLSLYG